MFTTDEYFRNLADDKLARALPDTLFLVSRATGMFYRVTLRPDTYDTKPVPAHVMEMVLVLPQSSRARDAPDGPSLSMAETSPTHGMNHRDTGLEKMHYPASEIVKEENHSSSINSSKSTLIPG